MGTKLHLIPAALRQKVSIWHHMRNAYEQAAAEHAAKNDSEAAAPAPPAELVIADRDWGNMSGRVVELRTLDLAECTACEDAVFTEIGTEPISFPQFDGRRQDKRLRKAIVAVSEAHVHPDKVTTAPLRPVTELLLDGAGGAADSRGITQKTGLAFADLFGLKDVIVLRAWDKSQHAVSQDDLDQILGNAIPTTK